MWNLWKRRKAKLEYGMADLERIRGLTALLIETGLSEIEVTQHGRYFRVARKLSGTTPRPMDANIALESNDSGGAEAKPDVIRSLWVGVEHLAGADGKLFVREGEQVEEGRLLAVVEILGEMHQVRTPRAGRIIFVNLSEAKDNLRPTEYDDPLFHLL